VPVAGFTGTLTERAADDLAAGLVRAKTGTLTGVNTLAGTAVDAEGRLLAFAFLAEGTPAKEPAESALDRLAATVAACGCRG
jgi:D-alanyl-D-alanine carboxypeptidase/D-alanyl-D-alanine-endopeptidase (penicillin-binding protein 4)